MDNTQEPQTNARSYRAVSWPTLLGRLLGAVGLVLWASAPLTYLLSEMGPLLAFKIVLGGFFLLFYLATNRDFFTRARSGRSGSLLALSATTVGLIATAVVGINVYVAHHGAQFDCTREGLYTLSPQTLGVLERLDTEVELYGFFASTEPSYASVDEALQRYAKVSPHVRVQMVDPQARPDLANKYAITERGPRLVVVAKGRDTRAKNTGEDELTNAVMRVVEQGGKAVYFLTGHGEGDTQQAEEAEGFATFAQAIVADGYRIDTLNLQAQAPSPVDAAGDGGDEKLNADALEASGAKGAEPKPIEIPKEVGVLVVLAPMHKLLAPEVAAIEHFLADGGRVMAFEETRSTSNLADVWRAWHIEAREDMIVDTNPMGRLLGLGVASPIIQPVVGNHAIVRGINGVIMTTARSLLPLQTGLPDVHVEPLMLTGESAWGETQLRQGATIARDDQDHLPPLYTAVAASREIAPAPGQEDHSAANADADAARAVGKEGRLVLFGDSDWVSNRLFRLQSNEDLALNALGWLTEQEGKVTIRPKVRAQNQLYLSGEQLNTLKFLSMDIIPVLLVALGLGVVLIRRQR